MKPKYFFVFVFLLLGVCSLLRYIMKPVSEDHAKNRGLPWEEYDSTYFRKFQSVNSIIIAADRQFEASQKNSLEYYNYIAEIIRKRFYHGYSHYSLHDNPLAFFAGRTWDHLSAIVIPDDILKHPMAACSQQALVLMEIFKRQGIDFRKVGFPGHFALEGKIEGKWMYFDTNMEPDFKNRRESLENLIKTNRFDSVYSVVQMDKAYFHKQVSNPQYGKINGAPAPNATLLHKVCYFLVSPVFLLLLLILNGFYFFRSGKVKKPIPVPAEKENDFEMVRENKSGGIQKKPLEEQPISAE